MKHMKKKDDTMTGVSVGPEVREAAEMLWRAAETSEACGPVREVIGSADVTAAYAVQQLNLARALGMGGRLIGRKIGLTSRAVQAQLGVTEPDYGALLADMCFSDDQAVPMGAIMQPKIEAEVALVLERELTAPDTTLAELIPAVAFALPALEIVGSRIRNWDIRLVDTIADNASSGAIVLGATPVLLRRVDLRLCGMVLEKNGEEASVGAGAACMGHPLAAALWLCRRMAELGAPMRAGEVIMTGALGPMVAVSAGDAFECRISGLGSVRTRFEA
jgi:2-keto-4-pentenoate hydratase